MLVAFDQSFGLGCVNRFPTLKLGALNAGVHELGLGGEIPDEFEILRANGTDAVVGGAIVNATGGHDSVDVVFVRFFAGEDGEEALSLQGGIGRSAGCFDPGGKKIDVFHHRRIDRAGFDLAGPAGDEGGLQAAVVASPLGEGECASLFAGDNDEGVVRELVFFEKLYRLTDLAVVIGDLCKIAGHAIAGFRSVDEVRREFYFGGGIA